MGSGTGVGAGAGSGAGHGSGSGHGAGTGHETGDGEQFTLFSITIIKQNRATYNTTSKQLGFLLDLQHILHLTWFHYSNTKTAIWIR